MEELDPASLSDRQLLLLTYEKVSGMGKRVESQGKRITSLENWRTLLAGVGIAIAAIYGVALDGLKAIWKP